MSKPLREELALVDCLRPTELPRWLSDILEAVPGGVFAMDAEGRITYWNDSMQEITGYCAEEVIGCPCTLLGGETCGDGPAGEAGRRCALFEGESTQRKRCTMRCKDGKRITLLKNARLLRDPSGVVCGGIEVLTDISNVLQLEEQLAQLRGEASGRTRLGGLVGRHPSMQKLLEMIELAGASNSSVLILGETGTGKELVARAIHEASVRRPQPFVRVSCAALSETLLESELFGHVRGAFADAVTDRKGRLEAANSGTIFLDEIGDISPTVQTKLLRVLQEREIERLGDNSPVRLDVRVIGATNRDLTSMVDRGEFRRDLYYRLAVIPIEVPPLRERKSDIPLLLDAFIERHNRLLGRNVRGLAPATMEQLVAYRWPGNVRELEHAIEYAFVVSTGEVITADSLPPSVLQPTLPSSYGQRGPRPSPDALRNLLQQMSGSRTRTARALGVSRVTLWKWLKAAGIDDSNLDQS